MDSMKRLSQRESIPLIFILIVAALVRFYHLDGSSLWHDEGNTWALVQRGYAEIARNAAADIHPPGYYWLLRGWTSVFGISAYAIRSLSAVAGLLLVLVVYAIGKSISAKPSVGSPVAQGVLPYFALLAAWIAALNPFQIYYSQEARMYTLLALESAGLFWALLTLQRRQRAAALQGVRSSWFDGPSLAYILFGAAGLWTHYSFPIVLAAAGLAYLVVWFLDSRKSEFQWRSLIQFVVLNALIVLSFLPWLPTAVDSILNWPKGGLAVSSADGLVLTLRTLLLGPLDHLAGPRWIWLIAAALLPLAGIIALRGYRTIFALLLWLLAPIGLMFALGLYSDAFLKFLIVASPAWCLLAAAMPHITEAKNGSVRTALQIVLAGGAFLFAAVILPAYYADANARDNYAGVAHYVAAVADPDSDIVLLDAPGQQEVWGYYDPGIASLALPAQRPADPDATIAALVDATASADEIYALFWATNEADPERIVETWLDRNSFKGIESWQGNMRFVTYSMANDLSCDTPNDPAIFSNQDGALFAVEAVCLSNDQGILTAGETLLIGLRWRAFADGLDNYKVSLQLLNARDQVIAQRDSEPSGGSSPTSTWQTGDLVEDNHGLWVPFGTPPGSYRLLLAVYDAATGERLAMNGEDAMALGNTQIASAREAVPTEIVPMQHRIDKQMGPVTLVGYDLHRRGYAHAPETPMAPGDTVESILYWLAPDPLPANWPDDLSAEITLGDQVVRFPLADAYPTASWRAGELVRTIAEITYDGGARRPTLSIDGRTVQLAALPR